MSNYRRLYVPGGLYFFTVNLDDRSKRTLVERIDLLRAAWRYSRSRLPFETVAAVVLPDHFHCVLQLPPGDIDFSNRLRLLKSHFSRSLARVEPIASGRRAGERNVWQRRFWEHAIRNEDDLVAHIDYVHNNPVKHGHAALASEWPYSTWRRFGSM